MRSQLLMDTSGFADCLQTFHKEGWLCSAACSIWVHLVHLLQSGSAIRVCASQCVFNGSCCKTDAHVGLPAFLCGCCRHGSPWQLAAGAWLGRSQLGRGVAISYMGGPNDTEQPSDAVTHGYAHGSRQLSSSEACYCE